MRHRCHPYKYPLFSNIYTYRHISPMLTLYHIISSSTSLYRPSTTKYQIHLMSHAQYTLFSFLYLSHQLQVKNSCNIKPQRRTNRKVSCFRSLLDVPDEAHMHKEFQPWRICHDLMQALKSNLPGGEAYLPPTSANAYSCKKSMQ